MVEHRSARRWTRLPAPVAPRQGCDCAALAQQNAELRAELQAAADALRQAEWVWVVRNPDRDSPVGTDPKQTPDSTAHRRCPCCLHEEPNGHHATCPVGFALSGEQER